MLSSSARATTAAESRFRINAPNSRPRAVKVIALDAPSERVLHKLAQGNWQNATFLRAPGERVPSQPVGGWLASLAGETTNLLEEIAAADIVVTLSNAGENSEMAGVVAEACRAKNKMLTALILDAQGGSEANLLKTLVPLRPYASMLVVAHGEDYVETMLIALRA
jgi:hypothetical protein